eukprot:scaffold13_cov241-Pinguiococcus_pyrenoidosus.AAC.10
MTSYSSSRSPFHTQRGDSQDAEAHAMEFEVDVQRQARTSVRPEQNRFPFCVCWSPLPPLTWICPLIGHMGIADSSGAFARQSWRANAAVALSSAVARDDMGLCGSVSHQ